MFVPNVPNVPNISNTKEIFEQRCQQRLQFIKTNGRLIKFKNIFETDLKPPQWFRREKFQLAQKLFHRFKLQLLIGQLYGLLLVVYQTDELIPLMLTGNTSNKCRSFRRYWSTLEHVLNWYRFDPFERNSPAQKSLQSVRSIHHYWTEKFHSECSSEDEIKWITQDRLCNGQFTFIGMVLLFPQDLGFQSWNKENFSALIHFWRTIGYCLGIEDRFNLFDGSDEESIELCRQIYLNDWLPALVSPQDPLNSSKLSREICETFQNISIILTYNLLMKYGSKYLMIPSDSIFGSSLLNFREQIFYSVYEFSAQKLAKYTLFNRFTALLVRFLFWIAKKRDRKKYNSKTLFH